MELNCWSILKKVDHPVSLNLTMHFFCLPCLRVPLLVTNNCDGCRVDGSADCIKVIPYYQLQSQYGSISYHLGIVSSAECFIKVKRLMVIVINSLQFISFLERREGTINQWVGALSVQFYFCPSDLQTGSIYWVVHLRAADIWDTGVLVCVFVCSFGHVFMFVCS